MTSHGIFLAPVGCSDRVRSITVSKKILLIEDHAEMRHLIGKSLRHLGYDLLEAADGFTGVRMALTENPDLVLLNISLPGKSGFEVAKKMKQILKHLTFPL